MAQRNGINNIPSKGAFCALVLKKGPKKDKTRVDIFFDTTTTAEIKPVKRSCFWAFLNLIQMVVSALAVAFAVMSLYDTIFEGLYHVSIFDCTQPSSLFTAMNTMAKQVSYIPVVLGIIQQLYQTFSVFTYFLAIHMGTTARLKKFTFLLLWYPIISGILIFSVFPTFYLHAVRLSLQVLLMDLYLLWLILTLKHTV